MPLPLTTFALLAFASNVACWGGLGHRTVGYLAEHYFTEDAAQLVKDLIKPTDSFDISDAAIWADGIRQRHHYTEGWHFIDAKDHPPESCNLDFARDCKQTQGCVVSAISNQTSILLSPHTTFRTRNEALKFLIHFIGDIHQPLHAEDLSRGGNDIPVSFDGHLTQRTNLHSVWDSAIARKLNGLKFDAHAVEEKPAAENWARALFERMKTKIADSKVPDVGSQCDDVGDAERCGVEWAKESNQLVCEYVLAPGLEWVRGNDLGGEYYEGAVGVVELQIARAGVRLAAWVNAIAAVSVERGQGLNKFDLR